MSEHEEQYTKSISFFNDRKMMAVCGEENSKWWFSVLNLIATINEQEGYQKARNYWKNLKTKLKRENNEQASRINLFKLKAKNECLRWQERDVVPNYSILPKDSLVSKGWHGGKFGKIAWNNVKSRKE